MYKFKISNQLSALSQEVFQYNQCISSSIAKAEQELNTIVFQYNQCISSSIVVYKKHITQMTFQYNQCISSSALHGQLDLREKNFNTTNV